MTRIYEQNIKIHLKSGSILHFRYESENDFPVERCIPSSVAFKPYLWLEKVYMPRNLEGFSSFPTSLHIDCTQIEYIEVFNV